MKTRSLIFTAGLLAVLAASGATAAQACKYCWSGENAEAADYARQAMQAPSAPTQAPPGAFPLDGAISQFQPAAPSATLSAAPAADSVVTSGADLKAARAASTTLPAIPAAKLPPAQTSTPKLTAEVTPQPSAHYADAGLVGLAAVGGVFCWRTRRKTGPVR